MHNISCAQKHQDSSCTVDHPAREEINQGGFFFNLSGGAPGTDLPNTHQSGTYRQRLDHTCLLP
jgi:hypothetical protein